MDHDILMCLKWIELYEDIGLAEVVCRRLNLTAYPAKWLRHGGWAGRQKE
jgi:hypothetical protein